MKYRKKKVNPLFSYISASSWKQSDRQFHCIIFDTGYHRVCNPKVRRSLTFPCTMPSVSLVLCSARGLVVLEATKLTQYPMASLPSSVTMLTTSCSSWLTAIPGVSSSRPSSLWAKRAHKSQNKSLTLSDKIQLKRPQGRRGAPTRQTINCQRCILTSADQIGGQWWKVHVMLELVFTCCWVNYTSYHWLIMKRTEQRKTMQASMKSGHKKKDIKTLNGVRRWR